MTVESLPPAAELLPHGPEALCLDDLAEYVPGERIGARLRVRPSLALYDKSLGGIPAWGGIEIMAQAAGICSGSARNVAEDAARIGYLAGVRHFHAARPLFEDGLDLVIEARRCAAEPGGFGRFMCRILCETETLAGAQLFIWHPPAPGVAAENPPP